MMRSLIVCGVMATALAVTANAQLTEALPLAANANVAETALMTVDGAVYYADGDTGFGARGQYKVSDCLGVYGAVVSPDEGFGFSGGAIYGLPMDLPFALAVRAGVGHWSWDTRGADVTALDMNGFLVASGHLDSIVDGLGWYANAGLHIVKMEVDYKGWTGVRDDDDTETVIHLGGGATYDITDQVGVFAGVDLLSSDADAYDETFIGGGVKVSLGGNGMM